jgi:HEPN domain-containing protein
VPEALAWLGKSDQHLRAARLVHEGGGPSAVACFLCQQAAETALKALLIVTGVPFPRTHDLVDLGRRLPQAAAPIAPPAEALARWSDYAVAPRYPGFGDEGADADVGTMLEGAASLLDAARAFVETLRT